MLTYDKLGRLLTDTTSGVPSSVDNTVQQLGWTYEKRGMVEQVTSYGASSTVLNQVKFTYNGFGLMTKDQQEHSGSVTGSSYDVDYTYAAGLASGSGINSVRRLTVECPSGKTFTYGYNASNSIDYALSRVASISEPGNFGLALYSYLGTNLVTTMERTEPSLRYDLRTGGTGVFGMDAWDRVNDLIWKDFAVSPPGGIKVDTLSTHGIYEQTCSERRSNRLALPSDVRVRPMKHRHRP